MVSMFAALPEGFPFPVNGSLGRQMDGSIACSMHERRQLVPLKVSILFIYFLVVPKQHRSSSFYGNQSVISASAQLLINEHGGRVVLISVILQYSATLRFQILFLTSLDLLLKFLAVATMPYYLGPSVFTNSIYTASAASS
jgi:hypothetical protein